MREQAALRWLGVRHVAVEHVNPAALDATGAGDDAQQG